MMLLTQQAVTTSNSPELARSAIVYTEDVDNVPVRYDSINNGVALQSSALYHNPDMPRYILHQSVHNSPWADYFDWETEVGFEVQQFAAQFNERYEAGVQSLPSYNESRLIYGR